MALCGCTGPYGWGSQVRGWRVPHIQAHLASPPCIPRPRARVFLCITGRWPHMHTIVGQGSQCAPESKVISCSAPRVPRSSGASGRGFDDQTGDPGHLNSRAPGVGESNKMCSIVLNPVLPRAVRAQGYFRQEILSSGSCMDLVVYATLKVSVPRETEQRRAKRERPRKGAAPESKSCQPAT